MGDLQRVAGQRSLARKCHTNVHRKELRMVRKNILTIDPQRYDVHHRSQVDYDNQSLKKKINEVSNLTKSGVRIAIAWQRLSVEGGKLLGNGKEGTTAKRWAATASQTARYSWNS